MDRRAFVTGLALTAVAPAIASASDLLPVIEEKITVQVILPDPRWRYWFEQFLESHVQIYGERPEPGTWGYELCSSFADYAFNCEDALMYGVSGQPIGGLLDGPRVLLGEACTFKTLGGPVTVG